MFREIFGEILEAVGPAALKALALAACLLVFTPLVVAIIAPALQ
jgi:hypothetical protein